MEKTFWPRMILDLKGMKLLKAMQLGESLATQADAVKIHSLWDDIGSSVVDTLKRAGIKKVWVDLKLKDTPDTIAERATVVRDAGADMLTVHIDGGKDMLENALKFGPPEIFGVTVLTSLKEEEFKNLYGLTIAEAVLVRALIAKEVGLQGIICSAKQVGGLSSNPDLQGLRFIVPGTRSVGADHNDQQQVDTPGNAVLNGATDLVVGRQVTKAEDKLKAFNELQMEIAYALNSKYSAGVV
ncbi:orotidine-5'-phosphate decarboxylase [Patescibacteria group bacterium]|nr:orotidine-5'-phosphate decarboxylase [Patescibacteria group bacterium]